MAQLSWDNPGERVYETGVDRGVLYPAAQSGVAWSGLTTITESPSGAEASPQYGDNVKYLNLVSDEQLGGTIEAFSYPPEFEQCDGTASPSVGLMLGQQTRKSFGLAYRTRIGNDLKGTDFGYTLHFIYNALAAPAEKAYATVSDSPEALSFSWEFTSSPVAVGANFKPTSHISIDSTKVSASLLAAIEDIIYGKLATPPRLPLPAEIISMVSGGLELRYNSAQDLYQLYQNGLNDLAVTTTEGEFSISPYSRLSGDPATGFYTLGS